MVLTSAVVVLVNDAAGARSPPPAGPAGVASMVELRLFITGPNGNNLHRKPKLSFGHQ